MDSILQVDSESNLDWLVVRIRLTCSLAALSSELSGDVASGLAQLDDIRVLVERLADPALRAELAGALNHNYGLLLLSAGRNDDSFAYFDASIENKQLWVRWAVDRIAAVDSLLGTMSTRGGVYTRVGNVRRARVDLAQALALAERHELSIQGADVRRTLGNLELRAGNIPTALRLFEESDRTYRALGVEMFPWLRVNRAHALLAAGLANEAGEQLDEILPKMIEKQSTTLDLAGAELFRATAALMTGEFDLTREFADSARRRMRRWGCGTCVANATIIGLRADTEEAFRSGDIPASLPARALRAAKAMSKPRLSDQAATARMLAARLDIRRGNLKRAAELVRQIPRPGQVTPIDYRMLRRLCRAELAAAQGNRGKALSEIRAGLAELDRVRDRMVGLELVSGTALHGQDVANLAVKLVLAGNNPRRLFDWLERTRAQTYRYEPIAGGNDPELAERVAEVRSLGQSIHQAQHDGHPTATLRARRAELLREAHRLGWHAGRWGKSRPVAGLDEIAVQLGRRALVSFASSGDDLVAVVVVDGRCSMVRLGSAAQAAERAHMLNADLDVLAPDHLPDTLAEVIRRSARKQAELLDTRVIEPLVGLLSDRDLVVVPTGALYAVPWGVLPSVRSRPAVVAPSATAWLAAERVRTPGARKTVLVRGPGLTGARGEIDKLAKHYTTATQLSEDDATVRSVLAALDGAKLAHIAAHGAHEPENALFSRLELADGALYAHEMAGLRRPPQQVVFAACELALNRIRPGDEPLGFASALLASGSRTVIAPVTRVGDQTSAAVMDDYHRALAAGAKPASALAEAIAADPFGRPFVCLGAG